MNRAPIPTPKSISVDGSGAAFVVGNWWSVKFGEVISDALGRRDRKDDIGRLGSVLEVEEAKTGVGAGVIGVFGVIIDGVGRENLDAAIGDGAAAGRDVIALHGDGAGPLVRGRQGGNQGHRQEQ